MKVPIQPLGGARGGAVPSYHYHFFHPTLLVYCFVTTLVAIGAFISQNNLLFWLFAMALAMLVVSGVISGPMMTGLRVERLAVAPVRAGEPLVVRYVMRNTNRWIPTFALRVAEEPAPARGGPAERASPLAHQLQAMVSYVGAQGVVSFEARSGTTQRGAVRLSTLWVTTTFPFGIIKKSLRYTMPAAAVVRPVPGPALRSEALGFSPRPSAEPAAGMANARGDDFYSVREYAPGDSPRLISWRASARAQDLRVRQYAQSGLGRVLVVLWLGGGAARPADVEWAVSCAAGLVERAARRGVPVGLAIPSAGIVRAPGARAGVAAACLDALATVLPPEPGAGPGQRGATAPAWRLLGAGRGDTAVVVTPGELGDALLGAPPGATVARAPGDASAGAAA
ncbi:MAG: hypothetical protein C0475_05630 [Planctomyces sp.]|nr:hypothetical protein [Planctomyces sp.]